MADEKSKAEKILVFESEEDAERNYKMMIRPYFMENEEWYYFDEKSFESGGPGYKLTDKAPHEAIKSYEEFYKDTTYVDENGEVYIINY